MLAISMGVFAVSYGSTWTDSQQDQAAYQVGTTCARSRPRAVVGPAVGAGRDLGSLDGVTSATPVRRERLAVTRAAGAGELIGLVPEASDAIQFRDDQASAPLADLLAPLAAERPPLELIELPGTAGPPAGRRRDRHHLAGAPDGSTAVPARRAWSRSRSRVLDGGPVYGASVVLRDGDGLLHRFTADPVPLNPDGPEQVEVEIRAPDTLAAGAQDLPLHMTGPITIVEIGLQAALPGLVFADEGTVTLTSLEWSDTPEGDAWQPVDLASAGGWVTTISPAGQAFPTRSRTRASRSS